MPLPTGRGQFLQDCWPPELSTPRLKLRPHRISDFDACAQMWADPSVVRHISGIPAERSETWSRLLRYIGHWHAMGYGYWVIEDKASSTFLGEAGFADFKRQMEPPLGNRPEAGWVLTRSAHGRGLASEAVAAMLGWADRHLESQSTVCIMDPGHTASRRVAEKSGYHFSHMAELRGEKTMVMERMKLSPAP